jgi:hypothetical protein
VHILRAIIDFALLILAVTFDVSVGNAGASELSEEIRSGSGVTLRRRLVRVLSGGEVQELCNHSDMRSREWLWVGL